LRFSRQSILVAANPAQKTHSLIGQDWEVRHHSKALCTAATGAFLDLLEVSGPTFEGYARRHGWKLLTVTEDTAEGRPPSWGKIPVLLEAMRLFDLVAWVDADAVIVDDSRDLAAECRRRKHLYLVEHAHPSGETTVNAGVMMLRSSRWSRRLLERAWACEDLINHKWWENAALMRLLGYRLDAEPVRPGDDLRPLRRVAFLDTAWNSIPYWVSSPAPRIVHFPALPLPERQAGMLAEIASV
jgi:galactosyl transferase GMA12/MNN10 family